MNNLHQKLLHLLSIYIDFCKRYNLNWFVDGGTLLGVIRNKSFIPWDDDIDICMPRKDYDMLTKLMKNHNWHINDAFFQTAESDPEYFNIHARLRLDGTAAISERELGLNSHKGMFIDIYPLDEIPDDTSKICDFLYHIRNAAESANDSNINVALHQLMQDFLSKQHGNKVGPLCFSAYKKYKNVAISKDAYKDCMIMKFEDMKVRVPIGYDEILTLWYGNDYMEPKHENAFHSIFIDSERDYHVYDNAKSFDELFDELKHLLSD